MKKTAIVLYILASIILTFALTFMKDASIPVINWFEANLNKVDITEVAVEIDRDELLAGKSYRPTYTPQGDIDGDAGLVFTSLDPEYLTVSESGVLYSKKTFEGDTLDARVKITSKHDKDFEQTVTFTFVKKYPDPFSVSHYLMGYGYGSQEMYIGVPVYVLSDVTSSDSHNMTDFEVIYDEEYFERQDDGGFIPIKATLPGEKLSFSVRYGNGAVGTSSEFTVKEAGVPDVDEIRINNTADEYCEIVRYGTLGITLYSGGERVASRFTVTFDDDSGVKRSRAGNPLFSSIGEKLMTVTAANGFSKTVRVSVKNTMSAPKLVDAEVRESRCIEILSTDVKSFVFTMENNVTYDNVAYEYDSNIITLTSDARSFKITPRSEGVTALKLIVDDGFTRIEEIYTVKVVRDTRILKVIAKDLAKNIRIFVSKVLGHGLAFAFLAFFAMNMFKYCKIKPLPVRLPIYK